MPLKRGKAGGRGRTEDPQEPVPPLWGYLEQCELIAEVYPVVYVNGKPKQSIVGEFTADLRHKRDDAKADKNELENQIIKLVSNSGYGKISQAIKGKKKSLNLRYMQRGGKAVRTQISESKITNAKLASFITGVIRAMVGEYLHYCAEHGIVVGNITTDGFTTIDRKLTDIELQSGGPFTSSISEMVLELFGDRNVLELKHKGKGGIFVKTRCYTMIEPIDDSKMLCSLSGIYTKGMDKVDKRMLFDNEFMAVTQFKNTVYPEKKIPSLTDWLTKDAAYVNVVKPKGFNWDYDFKRKPLKVSESEGRICFNTIPFQSIDEYRHYRESYINFVRGIRDDHKIQIAYKNKITLPYHWDMLNCYTMMSRAYKLLGITEYINQNKLYAQYLKATRGIGCNNIAAIMNEPRTTVIRWIQNRYLYDSMIETDEFYKIINILNNYFIKNYIVFLESQMRRTTCDYKSILESQMVIIYGNPKGFCNEVRPYKPITYNSKPFELGNRGSKLKQCA